MSTKGDAEDEEPPHLIVSSRVKISREDGFTRMWLARPVGEFAQHPNAIWGRRLTDDECNALLDNPYLMYSTPKPKG